MPGNLDLYSATVVLTTKPGGTSSGNLRSAVLVKYLANSSMACYLTFHLTIHLTGYLTCHLTGYLTCHLTGYLENTNNNLMQIQNVL
jgi:hypothetical protein